MKMKFCLNCGSEIVSKMDKCSWFIIHVCKNLQCPEGVYQTILGDYMGGSSDNTKLLSVSSQQHKRFLEEALDSSKTRLQLEDIIDEN